MSQFGVHWGHSRAQRTTLICAIVLLRTKVAFCLVYCGGGGCEYRARRCPRSLLGLSRMRKARRRFATAFVSTKRSRPIVARALNSQNVEFGMSAIEGILLQNSSSVDCGASFQLWRFVGRAPRCGTCGAYGLSMLDATPTQGRHLPKVAGHGREAWRAASGSARLP